VLGEDVALVDIELAIVLGGDGTILRAAELVRGGAAPVLGINMGHVGFLAEIERDELDDAVRRVIARDYVVEERLALSVRVTDASGVVRYETWALNEATVEKASRERMLEVVVEIDGRPLTAFGCDGVVISTPTGSTAYNFSAGGPVVWPEVEAIAVVALSAHALFAKPLVVSPGATVAVEVLERTNGTGVLWCDGRRSHDLPPGARVVARRSTRPVRLARLHPAAFTDRLVRKFQLPVYGWRGPATAADGTPGTRTEA
jgi:NAD+ kinase